MFRATATTQSTGGTVRLHRVLVSTAAAATVLSFAGPALPAHASGVAYTWVGSSVNAAADNHSWTDSRNWSPAAVPGDGDSVFIDSPDASHCTAHVDAVPTATLANLSVTQNPDRCAVSISGGDLTVTGSFTWDGGTISTPISLATGSSGVISGANSRLNVLDADLDVAGSLELSSVAGTGGSNTGALRINDPDVLHVLSGASLTADGTDDITFLACCNTPAKIVNDGTFTVTGTTTINAVELDQNGVLDTSTGGSLITESAPVTAATGASYTGSGRWMLENHATARMTGTQTLGPDFHLELGGLDVGADSQLGGTPAFAGTGTFDWTGGTIEAAMTIGHGVRMNVSGVHINNGRRQLLGLDTTANPAGDPVSVANHGVITLDQGGAFMTGARANLVNESDGTLDIAPGTTLTSGSCCVNPDRITNAGGKVSVQSTGDTTPVDIDNIAYQATGGTTSIPAGDQVQLTGGAPNKLASTTVNGGGELLLTAPTSTSGTVTVSSGTRVHLDVHGTVDGPSSGTSTLGGSGTFAWTGGNVSGNERIATTGGIGISGTPAKYVANVGGGTTKSNVTLAAPTTFAAGTSSTHDLVDVGTSNLTLASKTTMAAYSEIKGGKLVNTGALTVSPGSKKRVDRSSGLGTTNRGTITVRSGTLYLQDFTQTAGTLRVATGAAVSGFSSSFVLHVSGGTLTGTGTIRAPVSVKAAKVVPGSSGTVGTLHISGDYSSTAKTHLLLDLAHGSHDVLAVTGVATVRGTVAARNLGTYRPTIGARIPVLTTGTRHWSVSCTTTSGSRATGTHAGHWAPAASSRREVLVWRSGSHTHC